VENWLADLLKKSRRTVHSIICRAGSAIAEPNFNLLDFQAAFPAQVRTTPYFAIYLFSVCTAFLLSCNRRLLCDFDDKNRNGLTPFVHCYAHNPGDRPYSY